MATGQHGGYRRPGKPAPASGPGALSKRTDGQVKAVPTGLPYGQHQALMQQESVAPMSATPAIPDINAAPAGMPAGPAGPGGQPMPSPSGSPVTPIGAPTQRPNEVITSGVNIGPGAGPEVLPMQHTGAFQQSGPMTQMLTQLSASDATGVLGTILQFAKQQGA